MITVIEHGNMKRYPQHCDNCGCIFEVQLDDTVPMYIVGENITRRVVKCPECNTYIKCLNIKENE
jgi:hypothetical protein